MSEYLLHAAVAEWLRYACKRTWWHSHQSGNLSMTERMKAKRMGRRAGVPDFTFIGPDGRAVFIELKADGGKQTESQAVFEESAKRDGALYAVCRSLPEVEGTLKGWGVI